MAHYDRQPAERSRLIAAVGYRSGPGDPWKVKELGAVLVELAEKIRDMVTALKKAQADDIKSVFIDGRIEQRDDVIPDLKLLEERYETSGNALRVYGDVLDNAQDMAKQARADS